MTTPPKDKPKFLQSLWPDFSTAQGYKYGVQYGVMIGGLLAFGYAAQFLYALYVLLSEAGDPWGYFSDLVEPDFDLEAAAFGVAALAILACGLAIGLTLWFWKRKSIIAASLILALVVFEGLDRILNGERGVIFMLLLVWAAIQALRLSLWQRNQKLAS